MNKLYIYYVFVFFCFLFVLFFQNSLLLHLAHIPKSFALVEAPLKCEVYIFNVVHMLKVYTLEEFSVCES